MEPIRMDRWPRGANNVSRPNRLPEGFVRESVNLNPGVDGLFSLRGGYEPVYVGSDVRHLASVGARVVVVDGEQLVSFDTTRDTAEQLGTIGLGPVASAELGGELFLRTPTSSVRTDGRKVGDWGVRQPGFTVEVIGGALPAGRVKVAVTATNEYGEDSGCEPLSLEVPANSGLRVTTDDPRALRLYVSPPNASTMYFQSVLVGGQAVTSVDDSTERLTTAGFIEPPACTQLVGHHGVLVGANDRHVFFTEPMRPHLVDPVAGFFQYPAPVSVLAATDGGVYIVADKTYFVTGLETAKPQQRVVREMGAVAGSATILPDGRVAWFTRYGQAFGSPSGEVLLPNETSYAPDTAGTGAAGLVEHEGNQLVVTTMRGVTNQNNLAAGDYADLETGNE